ncbi:MAG: hypothetical protein U9R03_04465 [Candidatus Aerophobetes bacterium]|nr:hypothetical protein [Candidatus Aerophobetes bacterium]
MKYTIIKDNKFTGTTYESLNNEIKEFHLNRGDFFLEIISNPTKIQPADIEVEPGLMYTPEEIFVDPTLEEIELSTILSYEFIAELHIQEVVNGYNLNNGLKFSDVYGCANYINSPTYSHYDFCVAVWNFNVEVWEYLRQLLMDIKAETTNKPESIEEFKSLLPLFGS